MRWVVALVGSVLVCCVGILATDPSDVAAQTAKDLSDRIVIDGFTNDFMAGEAVFGFSPVHGGLEESESDSKWGSDNDIHQIRITWDKDSLYVAVEAVTWGNNILVWFDVIPDEGLSAMWGLNSWRRLFQFSDDFRPDIFLGTWDGNDSPMLLIHQGGDVVDDQRVGALFNARATFYQDQPDRAMECAIPWNTLFLGSEGHGTTPVFVPTLGETLQIIPPDRTTIKVAGAITAGMDGTGGPDSAPNNTTGHVVDGAEPVLIDNYARIALDELDDSGLGVGGPDGVADWGILPKYRVDFKVAPSVQAVSVTWGRLKAELR